MRFQISTRLTSWVAVDQVTAVDPRDPTRRVHVPQNLPYGMSVEGARAAPGDGDGQDGDDARDAEHGGCVRGDGEATQPRSAPRRRAGRNRRTSAASVRACACTGCTSPPPGRDRPGCAGPLDAVSEFFKKERSGRRARGRVVSRTGDELLVELTAEGGPLDWILGGATITVHFADGSTCTATISIDRSTREGTLADGTSARAALHLASATSAAPTSVTFELVDVTLTVIL